MSHGKNICKCGKVLSNCRCAHDNIVTVTATCEHNWAVELKEELENEYGISSYANVKMHSQWLEVELPATRQTLDIGLTNVYGFVISLNVSDETGGVLKEVDLYSCVKREDLADTISNFYNSY
ncbi:hypothetical protein SEA_MOAB_246 [Streptomyces phage Moab]|nr:hypothetical protein SEA_MOAB_246 [Streptomyces phage Moab]WMI33848.1 hypothetical protein SEA_PATELGO_246 [Streptomyces phage Patelgo]